MKDAVDRSGWSPVDLAGRPSQSEGSAMALNRSAVANALSTP
jgi:hypothetical protein